MKNSSLGTKILMAVICLAILAYFGIQGFRYYNDPLTTTVAYAYQVEESTAVTGWIIRDEQVLANQSSGLLRLSRTEGEKVSKGGKVAMIYADQASLKKQDEIESLETQVSQLQYAEEAVLSNEISLKLDSQITEGVIQLRKDLTADRLDSADSHINQLRALILKRDYTYSDNEDLESQIQDLQSQVKTLKSAASSSVKAVTAPVSGLYSAAVDGYETVLTPSVLKTLTPSELTKISKDDSVSSNVGKLILGDTWYYAVSMNASDAAGLTVGKFVTLRLAKGFDQDLSVKLDSLSAEEDGRVVAVFSSDRYLEELTMLRKQSADIITDTVDGLRVPQNAIRVSENGETGLYCVVGMVARFKPVTVVYTGEDFALVRAVSNTNNRVLRSGDEIIITANHLYDGKVVS